MIKRLNEIVQEAKRGKSMTLSVACGEDPHTIEAVGRAVREGIVKATLIGDRGKSEKVSKEHSVDPQAFEIMDEREEGKALRLAVRLVKQKERDFLMKGLVDTSKYMKAILDKEMGLLPPGQILSHVTVVEFPLHPKLLIVSDVAVIPKPDLLAKIAMTSYCIEVAHSLAIEKPKVAIIAAVEKVNLKMDETLHAAVISKMAERGQIKGGIVDGPLALDTAVSKESCEIKGLKSAVDGDADVLIFPNIETANVFFKTCTQLAGGEIAGVVAGTEVPCILTSRADSEDSKFYSIALGAVLAGGMK
jgi:phosphate butyryltransferase